MFTLCKPYAGMKSSDGLALSATGVAIFAAV